MTIFTTILAASATPIAMIVVQIIVSMKQQRVQDVRFELTIKEIKDDIARLEKKQDKHNELIERMVKVEKEIETIKEK